MNALLECTGIGKACALALVKAGFQVAFVTFQRIRYGQRLL